MSETLPVGIEPLNLYGKKYYSALVPVSLLRLPAKQLTWLDKCLYGQLRFTAGNSDRCRVTIGGEDQGGRRGLSKELAISEDSVSRSIKRLSEAGLVFTKRLRSEILIVFLNSPLLDASTPEGFRNRKKSVGPEPAAVRVLTSHPEPAAVRVQSPQSEGPEPAAVRVAYKESGFSSGLQEYRSSRDASDAQPLPSTEIATAAAPVLETSNPKNPPGIPVAFELSAADRKSIAEASNVVVSAAPLGPSNPLVVWMATKSVELGGSAESLVRFMESRAAGVRRRFARHGIWKTLIPEEFPDFLLADRVEQEERSERQRRTTTEWQPTEWIEEAAETESETRAPEREHCKICGEIGQVYTGVGTIAVKVAFCACPAGEAKRAQYGDQWAAKETEKMQAVESNLARYAKESEKGTRSTVMPKPIAPRTEKSFDGPVAAPDFTSSPTRTRDWIRREIDLLERAKQGAMRLPLDTTSLPIRPARAQDQRRSLERLRPAQSRIGSRDSLGPGVPRRGLWQGPATCMNCDRRRDRQRVPDGR